MVTVGTAYFPSEQAAATYYKRHFVCSTAEARVLARIKIKEGEWFIGIPPMKNGQRVKLIDGNTRFAIEENEK